MAHRRFDITRPFRRRRPNRLRTLWFVFSLVMVPMVLGSGIGGLFAFAKSVPSIAELRQEITPPSTRVYADDDTLIGEFKIMKGRYFPLSKMPKELLSAVVSVEDSHFWAHSGIDYLAIMRAAYKDIMKGHLKEGGSTITQQLAKMTFLTPEKTFKRKLREVVLAGRIERNLKKEEILELYLNRAYFGHGAYGVEMAARTYFGKSVREITLPEAALIACLLKAPSTYSPIKNFTKAKARQKTVLRRMHEEGYITGEELAEAEAAPVVLASAAGSDMSFNYFLEYVKNYLIGKYGGEAVYKGGLKVYTTLDRRAQAIAQKAVQEGLRALDKRRGFRGPVGHRELVEGEELPENLFKLEPPSRGDILEGLVLSVDENKAEVRAASITGALPVKGADWAKSYIDKETNEQAWIPDFNLKKILAPGDVILVRVRSLSDGKVEFGLEQEPEVQGALGAIEPQSGFIRAVVGGYDFTASEYNRALYAERQVGSAFKPLIYALALRNGFRRKRASRNPHPGQ
jgi:penicillin-binding protein 1A